MKKRLMIPLTLAVALAAGISAKTAGDKTDISQSLEIFNAVFKEVQLNYVDTLDAKKAINTAIVYMLDEIDPYTEYYSNDDTEELARLSTGEYGGVGSIINKGRDGRVRFSEPYENTPSWKAGARAGDVILKIDSTEITKEFSVSQVSERLRGTAGTTLQVTVMRPYDPDSIKVLTIEREKIHNPEVPYFGLTGDKNNIGLIVLNSFTEKSYDEVAAAVESLLSDGATSLVLDLQSNPGGLLESAVDIVGLFVDKGTEVVRTKGRDPRNERIYKTTRKPLAPNIPLAILIDGNSASSAEIVAGSLQDLDRAVVVGKRSYGKGLVQSSRPLPYDGAVKITTAKYYIPSGRLIQAIDYSHRNSDGSVARTPDSLTHEFKTIHGRIVRDGGGITPDVTTELLKNNRLLYTITSGGWDIDYATKFRSEHDSIVSPANFVITDEIFEDFKNFINPEQFKYNKDWENVMKSLREGLENEGYLNDSVQATLSLLESQLKHDLNHDLDHNRHEISYLLTEAIVPRYAFRRGAIRASQQFNIPLQKAIEILSNPTEYNKLLAK